MVWNVTCSVLVSVLGGTVFFSACYGVHAYIVPHIQRARGNPDFTLPHSNRPASTQLQHALYSQQSLNYTEFRNSVADTELRSSRWSTSFYDIDPPSACDTPKLPSSTNEAPKPPMQSDSVADKAKIPGGGRCRRGRALPQSEGKTCENHGNTRNRHSRQTKSQDILITPMPMLKTPKERRTRSQSDSLLTMSDGLLIRSHSSLFGDDCSQILISPTTSTFTGTTMLPSPGLTEEANTPTGQIKLPKKDRKSTNSTKAEVVKSQG